MYIYIEGNLSCRALYIHAGNECHRLEITSQTFKLCGSAEEREDGITWSFCMLKWHEANRSYNVDGKNGSDSRNAFTTELGM